MNRLELLRQFKDLNGNFAFNDADGDYLPDTGDDLFLAQYDYDLAADGNRTGVTEKTLVDSVLQETRIDWLYDALGRLDREVYDSHYDDALDYTADYAYDLVGNRLAKKTDKDHSPSTLDAYRLGAAMSDEAIDERIDYVYDANDRLLTEAKDDLTVGNGIRGTPYLTLNNYV
jgi:hypothetical protein